METPPGASRAPKVRAKRSHPPKTVLIADDEPGVRRAIDRILTRAGHRVLAAADGREALALFESDPDIVDAVVLDLGLPDIEGLAVLRRIHDRRSHLPFVLTSGLYPEELSVDGVVYAFLPKPFGSDALIDALARAVAQGG